ncbi:MAG: NAD-dependent epimerase/dehydratase family protein [Bacteroidetes bacterium]|nr:NAD-dependent epimerase/dehydratase family protein [Bacteroidota bacterium]MCL1968761.1 NAD-dependent epimerase/dehydratase family protein [Bacteroidota bacterium]
MIVVTGAAGFIASHLCKKLNSHGIKNIILVDDFTQKRKQKNWENLEYTDKIQRERFFQWAEQNVQHIDFIFHLGARTDYYATDYDIFDALNVDYSQRVWSFATYKRIPLIYASSYLTNNPQQLSLYAKSKLTFDHWLEKQQQTPPFWAGLKFFQVYGNNEAHKAENASTVYKMALNVTENKTMFFAERNIIQDYIYVNDVCKILFYFLNHTPQSGIYEAGTGFARPLQTVTDTVNKFAPQDKKLILVYPKEEPLVFQANLSKLRKYAYKQAFLTLEQGVRRVIV